MKTLIIYGTQVEWTRKIAEIIADTLKERYNHEVILSDCGIRDDIGDRIHDFDLVIAGNSIKSGFRKKGIKRFLKKYRFSILNLAIFVTAKTPLETAKQGKIFKQEAIDKAINNKYIEPLKNRFQLNTISDMIFGVPSEKDPSTAFRGLNEEDITNWATDLHERLISKSLLLNNA